MLILTEKKNRTRPYWDFRGLSSPNRVVYNIRLMERTYTSGDLKLLKFFYSNNLLTKVLSFTKGDIENKTC